MQDHGWEKISTDGPILVGDRRAKYCQIERRAESVELRSEKVRKAKQ